ncbi:MAG TPA: transglycosylase domain-containing protein, partial [Burkholderiaceae bacterium]|nr:transglycosylase domain-containing protein [Burkholderiaceae bacterium]
LLYAVEMERTLGKRRILELYLNSADWGPGICGARAAARAYFGKTPAQLTPLQAAWLAAGLRQPRAAYEREFLRGAPDRAAALRVLAQMRELTPDERARARREALTFAPAPSAARGAPAPLAAIR